MSQHVGLSRRSAACITHGTAAAVVLAIAMSAELLAPTASAQSAPSGVLAGRVTDSSRTAIGGAVIHVQGTALGAMSASDGATGERGVGDDDWCSLGTARAGGHGQELFAQGGLPQSIIDVLNFALTLEYLEAEFYGMGVLGFKVVPAQDLEIFDQIRKHENAHVHFLRSVLGGAAVPEPTFDFTGGSGSGRGPFAGVFHHYDIFTALAQACEDTGVRAYKGQAPNLMSNKTVLTAALRIHSVEARHASEVRRLRGNFSETAPNEGWITRNLTDIPGTEPVYAGEENTIQGGVDVKTITSVAVDEVTESFDEPLTREQVLAIVAPFIVS
ncbi:MAG: ferritin-like domain-containing protein [Gemmatimonadaceae bacterium]